MALTWLACVTSSDALAVMAVLGAGAALTWPRPARSSPVHSPALSPPWLSRPPVAAAANFVFTIGASGGLALVVRGDLSDTSVKAAVALAIGIPGLVIATSVVLAARTVLRSDATEFEAHVLVRAAALTFGVGIACVALYTAAEALFDAPTLHAWWTLAAGIGLFIVCLRAVRGRYAQ